MLISYKKPSKPITLRDGRLESPWQAFISPSDTLAKFDPTGVYDCLIIGGDITGITTALLLQNAGKMILALSFFGIE